MQTIHAKYLRFLFNCGLLFSMAEKPETVKRVLKRIIWEERHWNFRYHYIYTSLKESMFGVFLVRIFLHLDWILSPYSVRMLENTDHKNPEYGNFSRSDSFKWKVRKLLIKHLYLDLHFWNAIRKLTISEKVQVKDLASCEYQLMLLITESTSFNGENWSYYFNANKFWSLFFLSSIHEKSNFICERTCLFPFYRFFSCFT